MKSKLKPWQKPKKKKALWMRINDPTFKAQREQLRPEHSKAGWMKWKSKSKAVADAVYNAINELFASARPYCEACHLIWPEDKEATTLHFRDDTHHTKGKDGLLYFDVRFYKSVCRKSHQWIGNNPDKARELGLLCGKGKWNKSE